MKRSLQHLFKHVFGIGPECLSSNYLVGDYCQCSRLYCVSEHGWQQQVAHVILEKSQRTSIWPRNMELSFASWNKNASFSNSLSVPSLAGVWVIFRWINIHTCIWTDSGNTEAVDSVHSLLPVVSDPFFEESVIFDQSVTSPRVCDFLLHGHTLAVITNSVTQTDVGEEESWGQNSTGRTVTTGSSRSLWNPRHWQTLCVIGHCFSPHGGIDLGCVCMSVIVCEHTETMDPEYCCRPNEVTSHWTLQILCSPESRLS